MTAHQRSRHDRHAGRPEVGRDVSARRTWAIRGLAAVIFVFPLIAATFDLTGGRFEWRMFSIMGTPLSYEVQVDGAWQPADMGRLGWLDRGRHYGSANLELVCQAHEGAQAARRTLGEEPERIVTDVRC